jgi:long-chain fatty acid transport protein
MIGNTRAFMPLTTAALMLALAGAPPAAASGFQLRDQSASGQGNAYAGIAAGGSDISSMFFNPAAMIRFDGNQIQVGLTEILPSSKFSGSSATRSNGSAISGPLSTGNIASSATLPTVYAMWSLSPDLKLGVSVNVPFGLSTNYDSGWAGRYHAVKSKLETYDIAPAVAWRLDPKWTVGATLVARHAKAELSQGLDLGYTSQVEFSSIPGVTNIVPTAGAADGTADMTGNSWAYGYKLGLLYEPSTKLHIGFGYQSAVRETLKGTASFSYSASTVAAGAQAWAAANPSQAGAIGRMANALLAQVANSSASAELKLPAMFSLGASYDLSSTVTLSAEWDRTQWHTFQELRIKFANPGAQPDAATTENWKDSNFFAVGATCRPNAKWTYRAGLALDSTPVPDSTRTPRIPDADRTWVSGGASYQFTKAFGMDAGYSHLFCKDSTVNLQAGSSPTTSNTYFQGNLTGTYKNSIDVFSVQARYVF